MKRILSLLLLAACVPDLAPDTDAVETDVPVETDTDEPGGLPAGFASDGETLFVQVDASDSERWVYLDLDAPDWTDADGAWSLAFRRYVVEVNGGVSGDAGVEVAFTDQPWEEARVAPSEGWGTDLADADEDGEPERAFDAWWDYDSETHILTPVDGTWFVRSAGGGTFALQILDYYSDAGDSGVIELRYRSVEVP